MQNRRKGQYYFSTLGAETKKRGFNQRILKQEGITVRPGEGKILRGTPADFKEDCQSLLHRTGIGGTIRGMTTFKEVSEKGRIRKCPRPSIETKTARKRKAMKNRKKSKRKKVTGKG